MYQAVIRSLRRRGYLPLRYPLRAVLDSINQYQRGGLHNGRLPQNCIEPVKYQAGLRMQFFAMTLNIIPYFSLFTFHFSPFTFHLNLRRSRIYSVYTTSVLGLEDHTSWRSIFVPKGMPKKRRGMRWTT